MNYEEFIGHLSEVSGADLGEVLQEFFRRHVRMVFMTTMAAEVEHFCGPAYRAGAAYECRRAGSAKGVFYDGLERVRLIGQECVADRLRHRKPRCCWARIRRGEIPISFGR